jgi:TetR/AcrR family transcriptional repressor of bet genes
MPGKRASEGERREQILRAAFEVASREGVGSLTIRAVAAEAQVSHALVIFHFQRKERLVHALLDWLIEATSVLHVSEDIAAFPRALDRLHALLQQEMARLSRQPRHVRLFLDYWALGARQEAVRVRIGAELERYRSAFRVIMAELLAAEPAAFSGATADGLAAVAVSWIHGCAVQALIDPAHFDSDEYLTAVRGIVAELA